MVVKYNTVMNIEVTGIENPKGTGTQDKHLVEFEPVVFEFNRKQDSD